MFNNSDNSNSNSNSNSNFSNDFNKYNYNKQYIIRNKKPTTYGVGPIIFEFPVRK